MVQIRPPIGSDTERWDGPTLATRLMDLRWRASAMGLTARAKELRQELDVVADRVRHPALELGHFTMDARFDRTGDELTVPKREWRAARLRRAALILATNTIFD